MLKKILEVQEVALAPVKNKPSKLKISATGIVPSGGWKAPLLVPYVYLAPPPDGIYDFDFIAEAPDPKQAVIKITTAISCEFTLDDVPDDLTGVRVHTSKNWKTASR